MIMNANNNGLSQNMISQDLRLFDGSGQFAGTNQQRQRMDNNVNTPVAAFLRGGAPAPAGSLMLPNGIGSSSLPASFSTNSNSFAASAGMNMNMNLNNSAHQVNNMNNNLNSLNNNLNSLNNNLKMNNLNSMNNNLNLSDLKRLQQLHQLKSNPTNSLLMNSNARQQADQSAAFLQNFLDQKVQTSRFDDSFRQTLGIGAGMGTSSISACAGVGNAMGAQQAKNFMSTKLLQDHFFMNQNALTTPSSNVKVNNANHNATKGTGPGELPLPSPHSLFNRDGSRRMRGGVIEPFPEKLHRLLVEVEAAGRSDVISFVANGRAFAIHKPEKFFKEIVPLYFRQSRLSSFKRQLNLYGFELINTGPARGGYYHELFVKDHPEMCRRMRRVAVKVASRGDDGDGLLETSKKDHDSVDEA